MRHEGYSSGFTPALHMGCLPHAGAMDAPDPAPDSAAAVPVSVAQASARDHAPLSDNQKTFVALALACDLEISDPSQQPALRERYNNITRQKDAADYINEVAQKFGPPQPPRPWLNRA